MREPMILLVDDEKGTRKILKEFLEERIKCRVSEASNGEEALEQLEKHNCDLMLLDIRMPRKSGIQVLDQLPSNNDNLNVLVLTAWDSQWINEECVKRNVECLSKPFRLHELFEKIKHILRENDLFYPIR